MATTSAAAARRLHVAPAAAGRNTRSQARARVAFAAAGGVVAAAACGRAPASLEPAPTATAASASAAPVTAASPSILAAPAPAPARPSWLADGLHPEALGPFTAQDRPDACGRCHAEIAREWRGSLHRRAHEDPYFQAAHRLEPAPFCVGCHAPSARGAPPDAAAIADGVSCAVCHVRGDAVLGTGTSGASREGSAKCAKRVLVDAAFATPSACVGCHQFAFPVPALGERADERPLMQRTIDEWRSSAAGRRGASCASCHMPVVVDAAGRRHRSHAFLGVDASLLRHAVRVEVSATRDAGGVTLTLVLAADKIGHAFPTGDLYRSLEVTAAVAGHVRTRALLGRVYRVVEGKDASGKAVSVRRETRDDRVPPSGSRTVTLLLHAAAGETIEWAIAHLRTPPAIAAMDGVAVDATEVSRGEVVAP